MGAVASARARRPRAPNRRQLPRPHREPPVETPLPAGLNQIESHSHPGRFYYRNDMPPPLTGYPIVRGDALFTFEVAGEAHHQEALVRIVGGRRDASIYFRVMAVLTPEPDNPVDPNAIAVRIDGETAAYIKRQENVMLRQALNGAGVPGEVQCRAEIAGGWSYQPSGTDNFGVKLDITFPLRVDPAPDAPTEVGRAE